MILDITAHYAVVLAIVMLALWVNVTRTRAATGVSIGDNGDVALHEKIRRYGNFTEWVPMVLGMIALAELRGAGPLWLHAAGLLLVASRLIHPLGLRADNAAHPLRILGNMGSLIALVIATGTIVATLI